MKNNLRLLSAALLSFLISNSIAATNQNQAVQPWRLGEFMELASQNPARLLRVGNALFSQERISRVSADAALAFEWQDRMALLSALSAFFDPAFNRKINVKQLAHARRLLVHALLQDPALFVRDGAVESIRRIIRMQPADAFSWRAALEKAFVDPKNIHAKEGLFIRETILTAMREANLKPSQSLIKIARADKNENVKEQLKLWDTRAFEDLRSR